MERIPYKKPDAADRWLKKHSKPKNGPVRTRKWISKAEWLDTHKAFLRWKKTPEFLKWRHKQFLKQGGTCYYCDLPLGGTRQNIDHVIPKIRGGDNRKQNLVLACAKCNKDKYSDLLPYKQRQALEAKNKKKKGTYLKLKETFKSESELAVELREMFRDE